MNAVLAREAHEYLAENPTDRTDWVSDGYGNQWARCSAACDLKVVRPGKVQCTGIACDTLEGYWPEDDLFDEDYGR